MMRAIGFLSGVCLTVAALVLVLDSRENRPPAAMTPVPTAEQLSQVVAAIAEHVDLVPEANLSAQDVTPPPETTTAGNEPQRAVDTGAPDVAPQPEGQASAEAVAPQPQPATADYEAQRAVDTAAPDRIQQPEVQAAAEAVASRPHTAVTGNDPQRAVDTAAPAPGQQPDVPAAAQADASSGRDGTESGTFLFWSPFRSMWAAEGFARRLTAATQVPVEVVDGGPGNYRVAFGYHDELQRRARVDRITTITGLTLE